MLAKVFSSGLRYISPVKPSMTTVILADILDSNLRTPITAGIPRARAKIALCELAEPWFLLCYCDVILEKFLSWGQECLEVFLPLPLQYA